MSFFTRRTYSSSKRRGRPAWADRDAPEPLAAWVIGVLIFLLVLLTGLATMIDIATGIGFGLTAAGVLLTLVTRLRSGFGVWVLSIVLGVAGLIVVLLSLPNICKEECSVDLMSWLFSPLKLPVFPRD